MKKTKLKKREKCHPIHGSKCKNNKHVKDAGSQLSSVCSAHNAEQKKEFASVAVTKNRPKAIIIPVEHLTNGEQIKLFLSLFDFANDELPDDKLLNCITVGALSGKTKERK